MARRDEDNDSDVDPSLRSSSISTSQPSTATLNLQKDEDETQDESQTQTRGQKRHHESGTSQLTKKAKLSGVGTIDKINHTLGGIVAQMTLPIRMQETTTKDTVASTIQGQAQIQIQDEVALTEEGQLFMVERFENAVLARTYLALRSDTLRNMWLKKQLGEKAEEYWIDWSA